MILINCGKVVRALGSQSWRLQLRLLGLFDVDS